MPVVIGSVWDGPNQPTVYPPLATNFVSEIKTRTGQTIKIDDTPGAGGITISTLQGGSSVTLAMDGSVTINALTQLNLNAKTSINLTAPNVAVAVTGAMTVT